MLGKILNEKGELLDSDFDKYNIRVNDSISSKDNLIISRKRMVLLCNTTLVQKEVNKRMKKAEEEQANLVKKRARKEKSNANKASKIAKQRNRQAIYYKQGSESDEDAEED
jgi:hypothetical protein